MAEGAVEDGEEEYKLEDEYSEHETGKCLSLSEAFSCLTCVGPTFRYVDNTKQFVYPTFAYLGMEVIGRNVSDITALSTFTHIIYLNLTNNRITDNALRPLKNLTQLKSLIIDKNLVECAASVPEMNSLQNLSLKENCLTTCEVRELENILYLDLSFNNIEKIFPHLWCPYILPKLTELSLRGNQLQKVAGFLFSDLVSLFLAENKITKIEGLELLTNLKFFHLRNNPLEKLDGFTPVNKKLFYLNLRDCRIKAERELQKLRVLPRLERIVVSGNPFWEAENSRVRLIARLPRLRRINKTVVDESERQEAKEINMEADYGLDENEILDD